MAFVLCALCERHVRAAPCPFCGSNKATPIERVRARRVSRAARLVTVAAIGVACGGTVSQGDGGTNDAAEEFSAQPPYGVAPFDASVKETSTNDASMDATNDAADGGND